VSTKLLVDCPLPVSPPSIEFRNFRKVFCCRSSHLDDNDQKAKPMATADTNSPNDVAKSEITKHPEFWFKNGSVVVVAESTAFRIRPSILAQSSSVFSGLLTIPHPPNEEKIEDCPVVFLPDSADDIAELLSILYLGRRYQREDEYPTWMAVRAMLRLGSKYRIDDLRVIAVGHLERAFPEDIETWSDIYYETHACMKISPEEYISVANAAHSHKLPDRIRWQALYKCCQLPESDLIDGVTYSDGSREQLCSDDLKKCLSARVRLTKRDAEQMLELLCPIEPPVCSAKAEGCVEGQLELMRYSRSQFSSWVFHNCMNPSERFLKHACSARHVCEACSARIQAEDRAAKQEVLSHLAEYFSYD